MKPRKIKLVRLIAVIISVSILFTSCSAFAESNSEFKVERTEQKFSEIEYVRPDGDALVQKMQDGIKKTSTALLPFGILDDLTEVNSMIDDYFTMFGIAQIRNYLNVTDEYYSGEMEYLNSRQAQISNYYNDYIEAMLESKAGSMLSWLWGEESVAEQKKLAETTSKDIIDLAQKEQKLSSDYYYQYSQATVEVDGQQVLYSSLEPGSREEMSSEFYRKYNTILGEIFLELVENRKEQADKLGFENYVELCDQKMQRTYSRKQIKNFRQKLKRTIVPVYSEIIEGMYGRLEEKMSNPDADVSLYLIDEGPEPTPEGNWQDTMQTFKEIYSDMTDATKSCFNYMDSHEFIDAQPSTNKANIIFSTSLGNLNTPFLFANLDGTSQDVFQISHEFGHCLAIYSQQEIGADSESKFMDVSEIHSQTMQFLTMPYYEDFYGENADIARKHTLFNIMSVILSSAMDDEFQEIIYMTPDMSLEDINALNAKLLIEYGLVSTSVYADITTSKLQWVDTNQNFDTPFYSIDYSLSGCVALEFLQRSIEDYDSSIEQYLALLIEDSASDFETVIQNCGMTNPMEEEQLNKLSVLCRKLLNEGGFITKSDLSEKTKSTETTSDDSKLIAA